MEFSIIIPACNEEKVLENTLKAIKSQKAEKEIIVVCNGCTDNTEKIAKKYAKAVSIKERNVSMARNLGAQKSTGNILVFLDADIMMGDNCLSEIKNTLANNFAFGTCKVKPDNNKTLARWISGFRNKFAGAGWATGILYFKREIFFKTNGFEERVATKEVNRLIKEGKNLGKFGVADCYVINNMRRYEKLGYIKMIFFWIFESVHRRSKQYPMIR